MVSTHSCTMTQSTSANYMLKSAVLGYYFMSDMLLPYFFKLPYVPVRGRTQNMVQGTYPQQGVQMGRIKICHPL